MTDFPSGAMPPSFELAKKTTARVRRAQFGDGYSQRMRDGIHNLVRSWDLKWENLTKSEKDTIEDFFEAQGGMSFNWTPCDEETATLVSCTEWSPVFKSPDVYDLGATFNEEIL